MIVNIALFCILCREYETILYIMLQWSITVPDMSQVVKEKNFK